MMQFYDESPILLAAGLATVMLGGIEAGRAIGRGGASGVRKAPTDAFSVVDGALFALLGLVIAFSFASSFTRFEQRRDLIRDEANAVTAAYLRLDLLPPDRQPALRTDFRAYLDARLAVYRPDAAPEAVAAAETRAQALQIGIWRKAASAVVETQEGQQVGALILPALNDMIAVVTTRKVAATDHPPVVIYVMIAALAFATALHAGYSMAGRDRRSWLHTIGFVLTITFTVYVIFDLEQPRRGLIRIDEADAILRNVGAGFR